LKNIHHGCFFYVDYEPLNLAKATFWFNCDSLLHLKFYRFSSRQSIHYSTKLPGQPLYKNWSFFNKSFGFLSKKKLSSHSKQLHLVYVNLLTIPLKHPSYKLLLPACANSPKPINNSSILSDIKRPK